MNAGGDACHLAGLVFGIAYGYRGHQWTRWWADWRGNLERKSRQMQQRRVEEMEENVDRILDKVHQSGIGSLTSREKRILEEASKRGRT